MPLPIARRFGEQITTLLAIVAMLVFSFFPAGSHAPKLHAGTAVVIDMGHSHDHGDHSHDDDLDMPLSDTQGGDHHHADHTHEKLGLVSVEGSLLRRDLSAHFQAVDTAREDGPLYGIDRPPRSVTAA